MKRPDWRVERQPLFSVPGAERTHSPALLRAGAGLCLALWAGATLAAPPTVDELKQVVASTRTYDFGQPRDAWQALDHLVNATAGDAQLRSTLQQELLRVLDSEVPLACKQELCRRLVLVGTDAALPVLTKLLTSGDGPLTEAACLALRANASPAAGEALRNALPKTTGNGRIALINLLGTRRDTLSDQALASALAAAQDEALADAAIAALGKLATEISVQTLEQVHRAAAEPRRTASALALLQAARQRAAQHQTAAARAIYEQVAARSEPLLVRRGALLGRLELGGPEAAALLLATLRGPDEALKPAAIAHAQPALGTLAEELPRLAAREQILAIEILSAAEAAVARPAITAAAEHSDIRVRLAALKALGRVGDASAMPLLLKMLASNNREESLAAGLALRGLKSPAAAAALVASLKSATHPLALEVISILADRRAVEAVPALLGEAAAEDAARSPAAFKALGLLVRPQDLPALIKQLVALKQDGLRPDAEQAVVVAVGRFAEGPDRLAPVLAALQPAPTAPARASLIRVLGVLAGPPAYPAVAAALEDPDAPVRDAAVRALANWPDAQPLDKLLSLARSNAADVQRTLALRGYVRLVSQLQAPPAELAQRFAAVAAFAQRAEERRLLVSGLAGVPHVDALQLAVQQLAAEAVRNEAAQAILTIAGRLPAADNEAVNAALNRTVAIIADESLRAQARALLRLPPPPLPDVYLETLTPVKATSGNDDGKGRTQINRNCIGAPLRLKGVTYERGLGEHAKCELVYQLQPNYRRFVALVGLDDQVGRHGDVRGSIVVELYVDGKLLAKTPLLKGAGASATLDLELAGGAKQLRIVVDDAGDGVGYDDADFVNAGFLIAR